MAGSFTINRRNVHAAFRSATGPGGRMLRRRGLRVESRAKQLCPVNTGRLRSSISTSQPQETARGLVVKVGSNVRYGPPIHEGRGSQYAPPSWHTRGPPPRRFLKNALPAAL
jgi:hypothetical protein